MDVTLGVVADRSTARIALLDAAPPYAVIDQSRIDLSAGSDETLVATLTSTDRQLSASGHRLVATSVSTSEPERTAALVTALTDAGLSSVTAVSASAAVTEVTRALVGATTAAALVADDETAALSIVDADVATTSLIAVEPVADGDRGAALRRLIERFSEEPGGAASVVLVGAPDDPAVTDQLREMSPVPLYVPDGHEYAVARGAALAGRADSNTAAAQDVSEPAASDSITAAQTVMGPQVQQLAYSEVDDESGELPGFSPDPVPMQTPMQPLSAVDPEEFEEAEQGASASADRPRVLLLGSTVAAIVVVGFAALAVSVAIGIRPAVSEQAVRMEEAIPGKYFPVAPGQGVVQDPPAWTAIEELPAPGEEPEARTLRPKVLASSQTPIDEGQVIKYYRDGTIGVQNAAATWSAGPGVPAPVGAAPAPEFLTRLIPDFSRWTPCQVLALVSNLRAFGETVVNAGARSSTPVIGSTNGSGVGPITESGPLAGGDPADGLTAGIEGAEGVEGVDVPDLSDLGTVVVVRKDKGALFDAGETAVQGVPDLEAIPVEIFEAKADPEIATVKVAEVLPPDTKVLAPEALESLPTAGGPEGKSSAPSVLLTEPIPADLVETLPGTRGFGPATKPDGALPETLPGADLPFDPPVGTLPGTGTGDSPRIGDKPILRGDVPLPELPEGVGVPPLDPPSGLPVDVPERVGLPDLEQAPPFEPPVAEPPKPKTDLFPRGPRFEPPVQVPKPEPPVQAPVFEPPVQAPKPQPPVQVPKPEPPVQAPVFEPPVQAPPPVVEAPRKPIISLPIPDRVAPPVPVAPPVVDIPAPAAPPVTVDIPSAPSAPSIPSLPIPKMPELPFGGGGLFGSGSGD